MMKRFYLGILAIAAIAALTAVGSMALFTDSKGPASGTITSGTVTLANATARLLDVTDLAPGDSFSDSFEVDYSGNLAAWIGLDTTLGGSLIGCDGAHPFTLSIADSHGNSYSSSGPNQVVKNAAHAAATVAPSTHLTFNISYGLPLLAGNNCQGKSATLSITVHAVQAKNNTNATNDGPTSW